jgi:hypothetical protein
MFKGLNRAEFEDIVSLQRIQHYMLEIKSFLISCADK